MLPKRRRPIAAVARLEGVNLYGGVVADGRRGRAAVSGDPIIGVTELLIAVATLGAAVLVAAMNDPKLPRAYVTDDLH